MTLKLSFMWFLNKYYRLCAYSFYSCLLQALCKLSELDSSEISKEYKDPTDAYVVGDVVRGN